MSRIWSTERAAIFAAASALLILGLLTGNWLIATLLVLGSYILWLYRRLAKLEKWIRRGTKISQVYDDSGFVDPLFATFTNRKNSMSSARSAPNRFCDA